ncbi:MAG: PAS domain S-box protein, partial [Bacteroidota bacterium]
KASEELSATLDFTETYDTIAHLIVPRLADWFSIDVLNEQGTLDSVVIAHKDPEKIKWVHEVREQYPTDMNAPTGSPNVIRIGKSELYPEIPQELLTKVAVDERHLEIINLIGFHSVMIVPLTVGGKTFGVISFVATTESKRRYDETDLRLAEDFARRVALTMENVKLFKEAQERQKRFETLVESLPQMAWTTTPDGVMNYSNQRWREYTGLTTEVIQANGPNIIHPDDLPISTAKWAKAIKEETVYSNESRFKRKSDGTYRWHLTRGVPLKNENGEIVLWVGTSTDIHDHKIIEEKLKEQNKTLEILNTVGKTISAELETAKIVQSVTDACTKVSDAQFGAFFYNVISETGESYTLYTISGVSREEFSKFPMPRNTEVFHPTFHNEGIVRSDDITQDPRYGKNAPHYGMPEGHLPVKSYLAVPVVSNSGEVLGGLFLGHEQPGIFTENSETIVAGIAAQAAIALDNARLYKTAKESEDRFRLITDVMPQIVWATQPNGDHYFYNRHWFEYTGQTFEESKDKGWSLVLHPEDSEQTWKIWNHSLKTGEPYEVEYRLRRHDGEYRWFLGRAHPLRDDNGTIIRWFGTCTDIHDNKILEEDLRTIQAQLEERVKDRTIELSRVNKSLEKYNIELITAREIAEDANRAKSAFLSSMSHELRTPLNAILGFSQILKKDKAIPEKQRGFVETMYKSGVHLLDMINDVLDISKIESGRMQLYPEIFDLSALMEDICEIFQPQAQEKQLDFVVNFPPSPYLIFADSKRIRQILMNLSSNAIKFTRHGEIAIQLNSAESFKSNGKECRKVDFIIKDTGRGIPHEQHETIFEPFRQMSDTYSEGTGLGLAISKRIAHLMGGHISVDSTVGQGSTFTFSVEFEIPRKKAEEVQEKEPNVIGIKGTAPKILIVDDVESNQLVVRTFLEPIGFTCAVANEGRSALIIAEQFQPDIVLMDLLMPVMSGYEAIKALRNMPSLSNIPVIAITASGFENKREEVLSIGFNEYIRKPFRAYELFGAIAKVLDIEYIYGDEGESDSESALHQQHVPAVSAIIKAINELPEPPRIALIDAIEIQDFETIIGTLESMKKNGTDVSEPVNELITAARAANFRLITSIAEKLHSSRSEQ